MQEMRASLISERHRAGPFADDVLREVAAAPDGATFHRAADRVVLLPDGRRIGFHVYGARNGLPVIALHGTPGSRLKFAAAHRAAAGMNLQLISLDRWGYGLSSPHARPSLDGFAQDIIAVADDLGLERFGVVGISGGGPYAAAVAARLGARVRALALVAPVGPIAESPLSAKLRLFHRFCFQALPRLPLGVRLIFSAYRAMLLIHPVAAVQIASAGAGEQDKAAMRSPNVRDNLIAAYRAGLRPGASGTVIDMALFHRAWGVGLAGISARSRLWIGTADRNVPIDCARWLASLIPGCALTEIPDHGHFWVTVHYGEVLGWLAAELATVTNEEGAGPDGGALAGSTAGI